ncbi:unnamed protein product [Thelazia callipaeda]|uniref:Reverse transcriptase domain-containing protein n=1 Tax=Thelazia callipaeda TaxID=103827 RepID=A0A0N5DCI2_THECL|nr:unnamed protein product [Thelazia callipaeda]
MANVMQLGCCHDKAACRQLIMSCYPGSRFEGTSNVEPGAVCKEHKNQLYTTWYDMKEVFDSTNHEYLIKCFERLNMPSWISRFLRIVTSRWSVTLKSNEETIMEKKIKRRILQGDSLSPLLLVLCMDPFNRWLNIRY